jgi:thiol-disulfide isomerase/thioredoxin
MKTTRFLLPALAIALLPTQALRAGADPLEDFLKIIQLNEQKKYPELIPACETFLKEHPGSKADDRVRFHLGHSLVLQKKYEEGISALTELLTKYPETPTKTGAAMQRGEAYRNLGKIAESIPDFQTAWDGYRAAKLPEDAAHAGFHLVQGHHAGNEIDKAKALVETMKKEYASIRYTQSAASVIEGKAAAPVAGGVRPAAPPRPAALEVGVEAPDVEFVKIADGAKQKLSAYKGKVVVLDFWASWCGPCQTPMAKMQTYREAHPGWGDKVELIALSIDNTKEAAETHLTNKEWTKTTNVWAGEGGFRAAAPQAYRISGIPTVYIIDAAGKVAATGHPGSLDIGKLVDGLLEKK